MPVSLEKIVSRSQNILLLYLLLGLAASAQLFVSGTKTYQDGGLAYRAYNNYVIFKQSFVHLKSHLDLYVLYPAEHWDLFKYTPTFAAFFGLFHAVPDWMGLSAWNLLNALVLLGSVYYLPWLNARQKGLVLLLLIPELMTSLQNQQSNALIAGLLIFAFGLMERGKVALATLAVVSAAFIKLFGIVGFCFFIFYPQKWKSGTYALAWSILLGLTPLVFIDIAQYQVLWKSYGILLSNDHSLSAGLSVMGWLQTWFHWSPGKNEVVLIGALLLLLPLLQWKAYPDGAFRLRMLLSVLIWVVVFNHMAESPTYIIAMSGVVIWWVVYGQGHTDNLLFLAAMAFTSLSPTDIFPADLRESWVKPYVLKAVPCILIWIKIGIDTWRTTKPKPPVFLEANR